jgi:hypothetical protein
MRSEKIIKVVLKDKKLRKIRKNLRDLIECAVKDRLETLKKERKEYQEKGILWRERRKGRKYNVLKSAYQRSTLGCRNGEKFCVSLIKAKEKDLDIEEVRTDLDLIWIPVLGDWFCYDCVLTYKYDKLTLDDFPDLKRQIEMPPIWDRKPWK